MYVPPRPKVEDDPNFPLRLGVVIVIAFFAMDWMRPVIPALIATLPVTLAAGMRKAFNPGRVIGAPVAMAVLTLFVWAVVEMTRHVPLAMMCVMFVLYFIAFFVLRRTANPIGLIFLIIAVLMSVAGMKAPASLEYFRNGFLLGCLVSPFAIIAGYLLFPPRTKEIHVDAPHPLTANVINGALIRAVVLTALCFWLYSVLSISNLILGVCAVFPLVFPTWAEAFAEALERTLATVLGCALALGILMLFQISAHFYVLLWLMFMAAWACGWGMLKGRLSVAVYQFTLSCAAVLVVMSLTTQNPGMAIVMRVGLTAVGAIGAAFLVALLDWIFLKPEGDDFSPHPLVQRHRFGREL